MHDDWWIPRGGTSTADKKQRTILGVATQLCAVLRIVQVDLTIQLADT